MRVKDAEASFLVALAGHIPVESNQNVGQSHRLISTLRGGSDPNAVGFILLAAAVRAQPCAADRRNGRINQIIQIFADYIANNLAWQRQQSRKNSPRLLAR